MLKQFRYIPDENALEFYGAVFGSVFPLPTISYPSDGATGVSTTPTIISVEGVASIYTFAKRITSDVTNIGLDSDIVFNSSSDADVPLDTATGIFTLAPGVEYELTASPNFTDFNNSNSYVFYQWVFSADNTVVNGGQAGSLTALSNASNIGIQPTAKTTYRPNVSTGVKLRVVSADGTCTFKSDNSWATIRTTAIKYLDYTHTKSEFQIKCGSEIVYSSGTVSSLSATVSPALDAATQYSVRVRHKGLEDIWTRWTDWVDFRTA